MPTLYYKQADLRPPPCCKLRIFPRQLDIMTGKTTNEKPVLRSSEDCDSLQLSFCNDIPALSKTECWGSLL